jgi:periplasmic protein CpxP/Spy
MKTWISKSLAAALVASLGLGTAAAVAGPWGDCEGPQGGRGMHRMHRMDPDRMSEHMTQRLSTLQAALALRAEQAPAWEQFKSVVQDGARKAGEHMQAMRTQERPKTALEGMDRMESHMKDRMKAMQDVRKATESLYAVLDDGQKKTFDAQFPAFGRTGKGPAGKGPGRMGPRQGPASGADSAS